MSGYQISFPGLKQPGSCFDHPPQPVPKLKKKQYSYISTPSLGLMIRPDVNFTFTFTFTFAFHGTQKTVRLNNKNQLVTAARL
jgi:hypothetical protein